MKLLHLLSPKIIRLPYFLSLFYIIHHLEIIFYLIRKFESVETKAVEWQYEHRQIRKKFTFNIMGILDTGEKYIERKRYWRSEEHTSELQSRFDLVCRLLLEKKKRSNVMQYVSADGYGPNNN